MFWLIEARAVGRLAGPREEAGVRRSGEPRLGRTLTGMRILAILPVLTAAMAVACALWPAARRFVWPAVALAAINVVLTPLTSGEWFYQRAEGPSYDQAVARGDFAAYEDLLNRHDPHLHPRMIAMAVVLLITLVVLGLLHNRAARGRQIPSVAWAVTVVSVVVAALVSIVAAAPLL